MINPHDYIETGKLVSALHVTIAQLIEQEYDNTSRYVHVGWIMRSVDQPGTLYRRIIRPIYLNLK